MKLNKTDKKLIEMLKENTGKHMLDSGNAYGRHWEKNQKVDFTKRDEVELTFDKWNDEVTVDVTIDLFHFLRDKVNYIHQIQSSFIKFCNRPENVDKYWDENIEDYIEYRKKKYNARDIWSENSYNGESALSQIIQFVEWYDDKGWYVILQIHGGCDARSGYTSPVIFELVNDSIGGFSRVNITCPECHANWDTDDAGYSWEPDSSCIKELDNDPRLFDVDRSAYKIKLNSLNSNVPSYADYGSYDYEFVKEFPIEPEDNIVYVREEDNKALCPHCHKGILCGRI